MVIIVVALFVLCWMPFYLLNIINLLVALPVDYQGLYFFVVVLGYANSCANPIVYGFLSDNFKRGFRKALCRSTRRVENHQPVERQERPDESRRALMPRESLRRVIRDVDDDDEDMSEMTEVYRITQNGNSEFQQHTSQMLFSDNRMVPGMTELSSPEKRDKMTVQRCTKDLANGSAHAAPVVLNGTKNGNIKILAEENTAEQSTSVEISYL